jgi:hypothetical protein
MNSKEKNFYDPEGKILTSAEHSNAGKKRSPFFKGSKNIINYFAKKMDTDVMKS